MNRRRFFTVTGLAAMFMAAGGRRAVAGSLSSDMPRCRVTVLRRECYADIQGRYLDDPESGPCPRFSDGQQFVVDGASCYNMSGTEMSICPVAMKCITEHVSRLRGNELAGRCGESTADKAVITCCSDGTRPVIFKIEYV